MSLQGHHRCQNRCVCCYTGLFGAGSHGGCILWIVFGELSSYALRCQVSRATVLFLFGSIVSSSAQDARVGYSRYTNVVKYEERYRN
ncbi:hypothetical protein C8R48DRAFT_686503 [Suillus tomentosus]|nr:hypothetical protein C8R48DRAFT_686503 [Suillus tomentosus]